MATNTNDGDVTPGDLAAFAGLELWTCLAASLVAKGALTERDVATAVEEAAARVRQSQGKFNSEPLMSAIADLMLGALPEGWRFP